MLLLDNKPLSEFGIEVIQFGSTQMFPHTRDVTLEVPGRDGLYYFGSTLGTREFSHSCGFIRELTKEDLQAKSRQFVSFLTDDYGRPRLMKLSYDYEPDKYYKVRVSGAHELLKQWQIGYFTLNFIADNPFAHFVVPSDEIVMDSDIPIMSDLLWDTGLSERSVTAPTTFSIVNNGTVAIRFGYKVVGSGTNVTLSANGKTFSLGTFANKTIEVDGEGYIVKIDGVENLTTTSGDFIELLPGVNNVAIAGKALNLTINESLVYKYL